MNRYGQNITWSTATAPHIFSGECTSYSLRDAATKQNIEDEVGDFMAMVIHSRKAELSFEAKVTDESTDFLNLSAGAAISVTGISAGVVLATRAVETWRLGQPKMASVQATWFPDIVQASPVMAGTDLDAFTPTQTGLAAILFPASKVVYGTDTLTHAAGVIHGFTIEQMLGITEDEPSPDGKILGAASHGYEKAITIEFLAKSTKPAVGAAITVTGAPAHAAGFRIISSEEMYPTLRGKMYTVQAAIIPAME